jgi:hypothetical protein
MQDLVAVTGPTLATTSVTWSSSAGEACIRLRGVPPEAAVQVRPRTAPRPGEFPPMAGRLVRQGLDVSFIPRYPFVDGTPYTVSVGGATAAVLVRPVSEGTATTTVCTIHPTIGVVPRNLLRFYVTFSAPMSEGWAASCVTLVDAAGDAMIGALLPTEHELWDAERRRLTVLLDPARIKRGLPTHLQAGYALGRAASFRLVIDERFQDARGLPLAAPAARCYDVGADERRYVEPADWQLRAPPGRTVEPLDVTFDRPLDQALLARCLHVVGPDGEPVRGHAVVGVGARSWQLEPFEAWRRGTYRLMVDPRLEDLAGNSLSRLFDRDLTCPDEAPRPAESVALAFRPSGR